MTRSDYQVKVYRYDEGVSCEGKSYPSWYGYFYSFVYAIDGDRMLVYDDGFNSPYPEDGASGFCWVDFTETMLDINNYKEEKRVPIVELMLQTEIRGETDGL